MWMRKTKKVSACDIYNTFWTSFVLFQALQVGCVYFRDSVYFRCEISADSNPIMLLTAILNIGNGADFTQHQPQPQLPKKGSIMGGKKIWGDKNNNNGTFSQISDILKGSPSNTT